MIIDMLITTTKNIYESTCLFTPSICIFREMASVAVPAQRVIFLACGSFNPPTHLHLRLFELARDHFRVHQGAATVLGEVKVTMKEGNDT